MEHQARRGRSSASQELPGTRRSSTPFIGQFVVKSLLVIFQLTALTETVCRENFVRVRVSTCYFGNGSRELGKATSSATSDGRIPKAAYLPIFVLPFP